MLKKGGHSYITVHGEGGLINDFTMKFLRPRYQNDKVFFHIEWDQVASWHIEKKCLTFFLNNSFRTTISMESLYAKSLYNHASEITRNLAHNIIDYPN